MENSAHTLALAKQKKPVYSQINSDIGYFSSGPLVSRSTSKVGSGHSSLAVEFSS